MRVIKNGYQKDIGGGTSIKLTVLYYIAKVYFVENYVADIKLRRKFNARLLGICLKTIFMGKYGAAEARLAVVMDMLKGY